MLGGRVARRYTAEGGCATRSFTTQKEIVIPSGARPSANAGEQARERGVEGPASEVLSASWKQNPPGISGDLAEIPRGFCGDFVGISLSSLLIPMDRAKDLLRSPRGRGVPAVSYIPSPLGGRGNPTPGKPRWRG